jgi:hypothetical protein
VAILVLGVCVLELALLVLEVPILIAEVLLLASLIWYAPARPQPSAGARHQTIAIEGPGAGTRPVGVP